ncbi:MAG: hypothetical protein HY606_09945, partial [Planctomycetes bacterium]|nr:hypothetical protein [Planctomycetota bacterium]
MKSEKKIITKEKDIFSKRERVERTLNLLPVDRVSIMDHIANPGVVSLYTGKRIDGFNYSIEDICEVTEKTMDMCRIPSPPYGTGIETREDGFIIQKDNWQEWVVKRPFKDTKGLKEYYLRGIEKMKSTRFDPEKEKGNYLNEFLGMQKLVGDTVIMNCQWAGFEGCWTSAGLELFTFLYCEEPEIISEWIRTIVAIEIKKVHAIADKKLSPAVMVISDLATKGGPIFSPDLLKKEWFPLLTRLVEAWHKHGIKVIYHTDGNFKIIIDDFLKCG